MVQLLAKRSCLVLLSLLTINVYASGPEYDELMDFITSSNPESDAQDVQRILGDAEKMGKINLNEKGAEGWTPLCLAAAKGNPKIVEDLLNHGADLTQTVPFQDKKATPFILAAQNDH